MEPESETEGQLVDGDDEEPEQEPSSGKHRASSSTNNLGKNKKVRIDPPAPAPLLNYGSEDVACLDGAVVGKVFKVNIF